jgi:hypothetical protein
MTTTVETVALTRDEARELTDEVKGDAAALWTKLVRLYEGKAHKALGFRSWGAYYEAEFGGSASRGYQLLNAGRVFEKLPIGTDLVQRPHDSTIVERPSSEAVLRELSPILRNAGDAVKEAWEESVEEANGQPTAKQVRDVVRRRSGMAVVPSPPELPAPKPEWTVPEWVGRLDALASELMWLCSSGTTGPGDNSRSAKNALEMLAAVTADLEALAGPG